MNHSEMYIVFGVILIYYSVVIHGEKSPNIIFILTDDQDVELGGMTPMKKTKSLIGDAGITFSHMYTSSPLCCPSRSSILTGKYTHNHQAVNNSISGNCSSITWQKISEIKAFPTYLKKLNYQTFFAGKYLNQYGMKSVGGAEHVPPGWDHWYGLVGNSKYYDYTLSVNGKMQQHGNKYPNDYLTEIIRFIGTRKYDYTLSVNGKMQQHGNKYPDDYLTEIIGKKSMEFLDGQYRFNHPFFMMLSTPACHAPFTPAPQYKKSFPNITAPKNGSFNHYGKDKHWLIRQAKQPLANESLNYIETTFKNRWRTLLTVDDIVESLVNKLKERNLLDETYIFFSSDNGYHLGQFCLPNDKRQMYEFDIHVPLMVRGPGIKGGATRPELVVTIDLAPTFIDLAGGTIPDDMDGQSLRPILTSFTPIGFTWRTDFIVEHQGEFLNDIKGCPQYQNQHMSNCEIDCVCNDAMNNTYACIRTVSPKVDLVYCEFADAEEFTEIYNLNEDPYQLNNIAKTIDPNIRIAMNKRLVELSICSGKSCRSSEKDWEKHHLVDKYVKYMDLLRDRNTGNRHFGSGL